MPILKPRLFIGSSTESLKAAYAIQEGLDHDAEITVWQQNAFEPTVGNLENLEKMLSSFDFAAFVLTPDDIVKIRNVQQPAVRDNVIFESGLFIGRLGRNRVFLIKPRGTNDLHLPTDLAGVTTLDYESYRTDKNMMAALGPACNRIRSKVHEWTPGSSGLEINRHYENDLALLDVTYELHKLITPETIFIVTGTSVISELLDRPTAALLRDKIDLLGRGKSHRRGIIISDTKWLSDSGIQVNPVISIGGPPANKTTNALLAAPGEPSRWGDSKAGFFGAFRERGKAPQAALWGNTAFLTYQSVERYIAHGLQEFADICWK